MPINQAALFEFSKGKTSSGDRMTPVKHLIGFAIEDYSPIPRRAFVDGALRANIGSAVAREGIVPTRMIPQAVNGVQVFQKTFARLSRRSV